MHMGRLKDKRDENAHRVQVQWSIPGNNKRGLIEEPGQREREGEKLITRFRCGNEEGENSF